MPKHFALLCGIGAALALTMLDQSEARAEDKKDGLIDVQIHIATISNKHTLDWLNSVKDKSGELRMTASQVKEFAKFVQESQSNSFMQVPKMTAINGHKAKVNLTEVVPCIKSLTVGGDEGKWTLKPGLESIAVGLRFQVQPVICADQKNVTLTLDMYMAHLNGQIPLVPVTMPGTEQKPVQNFIQLPNVTKIELTKALQIVTGETALFHAGRDGNAPPKNEFGPPVLSKIKHLDRLFQQVSYGCDFKEVYVLVTPRIIVNQESQKVVAAGE